MRALINFNPRSREGNDTGILQLIKNIIEFQSTLPRRERPLACVCLWRREGISIHAPAKGATETSGKGKGRSQDFNPRSREGSDLLPHPASMSSAISIHAPAKGATAKALMKQEPNAISIHAPAKGATLQRSERSIRQWDFNPRSREGNDTGILQLIKNIIEFQSTLPRRERPWAASTSFTFRAFQSTLPRRERPCGEITLVINIHFNPRSREGSDPTTL